MVARRECNVSDVTENMLESDGARRELDRAARLVIAGELVASVTHDLRQPLTAIEMNVAAALRLLEQCLAPEAPEQIASIVPDAIAALRDALADQHRMREALQVLQDLSAQRQPTFKPLNLESSVREVVRLLASDPAARRVRIDVRCLDPLPTISADAALVRQALLNVLIDALQSTSTIATADPHVVVELRTPHERAVDVAVTRVPAGLEGPATRVGASLALAQSVVDVHGASLTVTRDATSGTTVLTRWPIRGREQVS